MKLKQLITGGALAATVLTLGSAQAGQNPNDGVVFCKAVISSSGGSEPESVSVTLPFTGGRDYTYWNIGNVPAGGVADSWHGEGGPGRFVVENNGRVAAYVYLTSSSVYAGFWQQAPWGGGDPVYESDWEVNVDEELFGGNSYTVPWPTSSLRRWERAPEMYCLAFTRDVKAKTPTWHMLDRSYCPDFGWCEGDGRDADYVAQKEMEPEGGYIGAYMGRLLAHDFMSFDVKFWAPTGMEDFNVFLTFKVEAASFPLWEHDIEVK